jgi:hypothetical protein
VGPRAGLDGCGKSRPPVGFGPRTVPARSESLYRPDDDDDDDDDTPGRKALEPYPLHLQIPNHMFILDPQLITAPRDTPTSREQHSAQQTSSHSSNWQFISHDTASRCGSNSGTFPHTVLCTCHAPPILFLAFKFSGGDLRESSSGSRKNPNSQFTPAAVSFLTDNNSEHELGVRPAVSRSSLPLF